VAGGKVRVSTSRQERGGKGWNGLSSKTGDRHPAWRKGKVKKGSPGAFPYGDRNGGRKGDWSRSRKGLNGGQAGGGCRVRLQVLGGPKEIKISLKLFRTCGGRC